MTSTAANSEADDRLASPSAGSETWLASLSSLRLHVASEVVERGGQSCRVVVGRDAVGDIVRGDFDTSPAADRLHGPRHRHRAGKRGVVRSEVHRLDDAIVSDDVDVARLDDVRVG